MSPPMNVQLGPVAVVSIISLMFLGVLALMMVWFTVPTPNREILIYILGTLSGVVSANFANRVMTPPVNPAPQQQDPQN